MKRFVKVSVYFICIILISFTSVSVFSVKKASASMPFYGLQPKDLTLRASFYTTYSNSSIERKHNIALAVKSLNNTFIDVNGEFSFNRVVGARTEKRGYKLAKIIVGGKFVDGVGGGVCQVSTTLYNAVLLSGLKILEYHPHSLPVSYVAPSFDAMVNSSFADLKFLNVTKNPIIIKAYADGERVKIEIYGEKMLETYTRDSLITETILAPDYLVVKDDKLEFPELFEGEKKILTYSKDGYKSRGLLIKKVNGKTVSVLHLRKDTYKPVQGVIVEGVSKRQEIDETNKITLNSKKVKKYFDKNLKVC